MYSLSKVTGYFPPIFHIFQVKFTNLVRKMTISQAKMKISTKILVQCVVLYIHNKCARFHDFLIMVSEVFYWRDRKSTKNAFCEEKNKNQLFWLILDAVDQSIYYVYLYVVKIISFY